MTLLYSWFVTFAYKLRATTELFSKIDLTFNYISTCKSRPSLKSNRFLQLFRSFTDVSTLRIAQHAHLVLRHRFAEALDLAKEALQLVDKAPGGLGKHWNIFIIFPKVCFNFIPSWWFMVDWFMAIHGIHFLHHWRLQWKMKLPRLRHLHVSTLGLWSENEISSGQFMLKLGGIHLASYIFQQSQVLRE